MTEHRVFAPAKVNLSLHVTGQRADGYHLLDSLVMFADVGDWLEVSPGASSISVTGPMAAGVPTDERNLGLRAAALMKVDARIVLEKYLPAAAGIGGGSSDAAAVLRALAELSAKEIPDRGLSLGADVPVCLTGQAAFMRGIGDIVEPLHDVPDLHVVLVNPGVVVPTAGVFNALVRKDNPPMSMLRRDNFLDWLRGQRNDLESPACVLQPVIAEVLAALAETAGCQLARMSGSGATCFGIYPNQPMAESAAATLQRPGWWVRAATLR